MPLTIDQGQRMEDSMIEAGWLLGSDIFEPENTGSPLFKASFVLLLINLRNLIKGCELIDQGLVWDDDVIKTPKVENISELITYVRDALCHPESWKHNHEGNRYTFNVSFGVSRARPAAAGHKCDYNDDVAFCFGPQRIYIKRHILRAFLECQAIILAYLHGLEGYQIRAIHQSHPIILADNSRS